MFRYGVCLAVLLAFSGRPSLCLAQAGKDAPKEVKALLETWQAAYFEGLKVGYMHTLAREVSKDGKPCIRTVREMNLAVKRYGSVIPIRVEQTSEETADGKVLSLVTTQHLAGDRTMTLTGAVKDGKVTLGNSADNSERKLAWNDEVVGQYYQEMVYQKKKVKAGDRFKLLSYELLLPGVLTVRVTVKDVEAVDRLVRKKEGTGSKIVREPVRLLRVEAVPDKIMVGETPVQLPTKIVWLDANLAPVREQFEMPGLGAIVLYHTARTAALKEGVAPELLPDLGLKISIPLKQTIDKPYETTQGVYRITLKEDLAKVFAQDARQTVRDQKDKTFDLVVKAIRAPVKTDNPVKPSKEYLESNQFIDSSNTRIRAIADKVVGKETDPWRKALKLETWVHDNMKVSTAVGFPSAGQICQDLEGDCRQHAVLLTALCRAAGLPARTAVGLIYARMEGRSPVFAFHMWTEVWVDGWLGLDAVLGQGGIGATHLKMGDHSWSKTATLAPLLPVSQALGKIQIDVVRTK